MMHLPVCLCRFRQAADESVKEEGPTISSQRNGDSYPQTNEIPVLILSLGSICRISWAQPLRQKLMLLATHSLSKVLRQEGLQRRQLGIICSQALRLRCGPL